MQLHWLLAVVLISAKLLGAIARRIGLPAVIGEILAGILLGPSVLGLLTSREIDHHRDPMVVLAQLGICVLLFRVGLETDFERARTVAWPALRLATIGMALPLVFGMSIALAFGIPPLTAFFIGSTLTATSIGVTASVMEELHVSATPTALLILGAAVMDDIGGLVLLAALVSLNTADGRVWIDVPIAVAQVAGLLGASIWLGRPLSRATVWLTRRTHIHSTLLVLIFGVLLLSAAAAEAVGLQMIMGAYATGLALSHHPERRWLEREFEPLAELFTPVFFVLFGSSIAFESLDVSTPRGRLLFALTGAMFVAAVAGKMLAPLAVRRLGAPILTVGAALVPRGEVGMIFAQVGLNEGVLTADLFAVLALVIATTTLTGPVLLRRLWPPGTAAA
jgi:Kef-type K+ transport system membrane component KefB